MKKNVCLGILLILVVTLALAKSKHAPLSPKVVTAKTVHVTNLGPSKIGDKVYEELNKWGRFSTVDSSDKADVEMVFVTGSPNGSSGSASQYNYETGQWSYGTVHSTDYGSTQMQLLDAKTKEVIYSDQKPYSGGRAVSRILEDLRKRIEEQKQ
jgi:hypothetical protein